MAEQSISIRLPKDTKTAEILQREAEIIQRRANYVNWTIKEYLEQVRNNLVDVEDMKWLSKNSDRHKVILVKLHHGFYGVDVMNTHKTTNSSIVLGMHLGIMPSVIHPLVNDKTMPAVKKAFQEYQRVQGRKIPDDILMVVDHTWDEILVQYLLRYYADDLVHLRSPLADRVNTLRGIRDSVCP